MAAKRLYDFGPVGGRLRTRVNQSWLNHWLSLGNIVELSCPTVTPYEVLEASGHVGEFSDSLTVCTSCDEASRADTLLEGHHPNPDSLSKSELQSLLNSVQPACPSCSAAEWSEITAENLMFNTIKLVQENPAVLVFYALKLLKSFTSFLHSIGMSGSLPFGAVQVGKGYRNEISPRQGMIRLSEFNMAELEYFINPHEQEEHDFSPWNEISVHLVAENHGELHLTFGAAVKDGIIRHPTVGYHGPNL